MRSYAITANVLAMVVLFDTFGTAVMDLQAQGAASDAAEQRPPAIDVLATIEGNAGFGFELHQVTITGTATSRYGKIIPNAEVFVANNNNRRPSNFERLRGQTRTNEKGEFVLRDVQLLVQRQRPDPVPQPVEANFVIFAIANGYGLSWAESRSYRPYDRPVGKDPVDIEQSKTDGAFYAGEAMRVDVEFDLEARFHGRLTNDFGEPLANAKIQVGHIDSIRNPNGYGSSLCQFLGLPDDEGFEPISFRAIELVPTRYREFTTNEDGCFSVRGLRRECRYTALISPGLAYDPLRFTLETSKRVKKDGSHVETLGYAGTLDHEFAMPRTVILAVTAEAGQAPVVDAWVTAFPDSGFRRSGTVATTDQQGLATFNLPPGDYTLFAEPNPKQHFLYREARVHIDEQSRSQRLELELRPAAVVELIVTYGSSGEPVPGVTFSYEAESSSVQHPLFSQTVFADYPQTNASGRLTAIVAPGKRRFIARVQGLGASNGVGRSKLVELTPGAVTEISIKLQADDNSPPKPAQQEWPSSIPRRLIEHWQRQERALASAKLVVLTRMTNSHRHGIASEDLLRAVREFNSNAPDRLHAALEQLCGGELPLVRRVITTDGVKRKEDNYYASPGRPLITDKSGNTLPSSVGVFNGVERIHFRRDSNQADVGGFGTGQTQVHITGLSDFASTREASAAHALASAEGASVLQQENRLVLGRKVENSYSIRRSYDATNGFLRESTISRDGQPHGYAFYFLPRVLPSGIVLPRLYIKWNVRDGKVNSFGFYIIDDVRQVDDFTEDAFAVALPTGSLIVDYRHLLPDRPGRGKQTMLRAPIRDAIAFLRRSDPEIPPVQGAPRYGQPAPELDVVAWLDSEGERDAPNLAGKVVFVEFWGMTCGPCIANLDEMNAAFQHFAGENLEFVAVHDSHTDVEALREFAGEHKLNYQLGIDRPANASGWFGETMKSFGVRGIPSAAVIDAAGKLVYVGDLQQALRSAEQTLRKEVP